LVRLRGPARDLGGAYRLADGEHFGVRRSARAELRRHAEVISSTLALIMRQQRFFVRQDRLEGVLNDSSNRARLRSIRPC